LRDDSLTADEDVDSVSAPAVPEAVHNMNERKLRDPRPDIRRLTSQQVREMRERRLAGETYKSLAHAFGISAPGVYLICTRKNRYAEPEAQPRHDQQW
jgi:hypothetical protein